ALIDQPIKYPGGTLKKSADFSIFFTSGNLSPFSINEIADFVYLVPCSLLNFFASSSCVKPNSNLNSFNLFIYIPHLMLIFINVNTKVNFIQKMLANLFKRCTIRVVTFSVNILFFYPYGLLKDKQGGVLYY